MSQYPVIVIGGLHHNTLGVIRSLGFAGFTNIKLILVGNEADFISCSKYIKKQNVFRIESDSQLPEVLLKIGKGSSTKPVVICSSDTSISVIDQNLDELSKYLILPNAKNKQGEINLLMSKQTQSQIAKQCGFNIPQTISSTDTNALKLWSIFPCIIKPAESINGSKSDIKICYTPDELKLAVQEFQGKGFQLQQFIDKEAEFQLIGCSLDHGEKCFIPGYTTIIRQPDNTNTGYLIYKGMDGFLSDSFLAKTHQFFKTIGYEGLFSVEFLRDKTGQDFFMEINMRNDGNAFCVTVSGINLPRLWVQSKVLHLATEENSKVNPTHFMPEISDLRVAMHKKMSMYTWLKQCIKSESHAVFLAKDPAPFIYQIFSETTRIIKKKLFAKL